MARSIETVSIWWHDFFRVETDRFLLFGLVLILLWHDPGNDMKLVLGALIQSIQNYRYSRPQKG